MRTGIALGLLLAAAPAVRTSAAPVAPAWEGKGQYRLLVQVDPVKIDPREADTMPTELAIDFAAQLKTTGVAGDRKPDLSTLQVVRYDPATGKSIPFDDYAWQVGPADRPFAWYDASIPYEFPEVVASVVRTDGKLRRQPAVRAGYFYNVLGDGIAGRLAWVHTQQGDAPANYAIYFDLLPEGKQATEPPPRGWIGDAMPRFDRVGASTTGSGHTRIVLDDWNEDGLIDIVQGEEYGCLFVYPNCGSKTEPKFPHRRMLFDAEGLPIDAGMHAAPLVVDWDGDGDKDLLVGTYTNRVIWYRNDGSNQDRKLAYQGFVELDGKPMELPITPVAGRNASVFKHDYYPVMDWVDWDGDGRSDLLAGGYVTGRIYFYRNAGPAADGTPKLELVGPLETADGQVLNVSDWCAAPCAVDLDGDGDLDLLSGRMPMSPEAQKDRSMLRCYMNEGSRTQPSLKEQPLPRTGDFPHASLATPRAADLTGDGAVDLVVSAGNSIFVILNAGTATKPNFEVGVSRLPSPWGTAPLRGRQFLDFNSDGKPDMIDDYTVLLNTGKGNPWYFGEPVSILPSGVHIAHPSGIGDDWFFPYLSDFDRDGKLDILFGDWHGTVWLHRNTGSADAKQFDLEGKRLKTTDGKEIKVGPLDVDPSANFTALQGARTVVASADFDGDGLNDLAIGDTYGIVRAYRNAGTAAEPVFEAPLTVGDQKLRVLVDAADWDGDGKPDLVVGSANGIVRVYLNRSPRPTVMQFAEGFDPKLPPIKQPRVVMVDLNRDGDQDLFLPSTQGSVLIERSFLQNGYAPAKLIAAEKHKD